MAVVSYSDIVSDVVGDIVGVLVTDPTPSTPPSPAPVTPAWPPPDAFVVYLGDLRLFGVDSWSGAEFFVSTLDGWDGVDVRAVMLDRPNQHGAFPPVMYYGARKMTLSGTILGDSQQRRRMAESRLRATVANLAGTTLRVTEHPYDRTAQVWAAGPVTVTKTSTVSRFSVPLVAPDPLRYDTTEIPTVLGLPQALSGYSYPHGYDYSYGAQGSSGDRQLINAGDVDVPPVLRIDGPVTNPVIRNNTSGQQLSLSITLAAGDWLDIDCREQTVLLNGSGSRRSSVVAGSTWPFVTTGASTWQFRATGYSSGFLTVRYHSAWS